MNGLAKIADDFNAISPHWELAAYEALWSLPNASVKNIAEQYKNNQYPLPSAMVSQEKVEDYLALLDKSLSQHDFNVCFVGEADFPQKLLDAIYPVLFFYYKGALDLLSSRSVAVVGTRHPTQDGEKRARRLVGLLVKDKYTIVSGLAKGIDTVAHTTAINLNGNTIAVIGTPINSYYPKENKDLQDSIAKKHLLVSQVPIIKYSHQDFRQNRFFFPERNKTMSAISMATIIVEAGETSGTLIQAREALKQNRKVFILDSCFSQECVWPFKLEEKGAIRVKDYEQIQAILKDAG